MITLPIFPLEIVVFPQEEIALHIFEQRYIKMINYAKEEGTMFSIIPVIEKKLSTVGTALELYRIENSYPDGRMDIKCRGEQPVKVEKFLVSKDPQHYHEANLNKIELQWETEEALTTEVIKLYNQFHAIIRSGNYLNVEQEIHGLSYQLAHTSGFDMKQKVMMLEMSDENTRLKYLRDHLFRLIDYVKAIEQTRTKLQQNGHFRIFPEMKFDFDI